MIHSYNKKAWKTKKVTQDLKALNKGELNTQDNM